MLTASVTAMAETLRSEQGELRLDLPYAAFRDARPLSARTVFFYRVTGAKETLTGYGDLPTPGPGGQGQVVFGQWPSIAEWKYARPP